MVCVLFFSGGVPRVIDSVYAISIALIAHIYLSISRPDLAKKEYEAARKWADDSLLIQIIEATIGLSVVRRSFHPNPYTPYYCVPGLSDTSDRTIHLCGAGFCSWVFYEPGYYDS